MLKLKVVFSVEEAIFDDSQFSHYAFLKFQEKIFDDWYHVLQFIQDGFSAEIKYDIQNVIPIEVKDGI